MTTYREMLAKRPIDPVELETEVVRLIAEVRAYRLRELREACSLTQVELAEKLHVSQNRISRLEHGDVEKTQVDTLRRYVEAVGGTLRVEVEIGDDRIRIA